MPNSNAVSGRLAFGCAAWVAALPCTVTLAAQPDPRTQFTIAGHIVEPQPTAPTNEQLQNLQLPAGFHLQRFAEGLDQPRMIATTPDGAVYVTQRRPGSIVMLRDTDRDGVADVTKTVLRLKDVHGIAIDGEKIYLVDVKHIYTARRTPDGGIGELKTLVADLPDGGQHPNRTLALGRDGMLYVSVGSTCNACAETSPESATMLRVDPNSGQREIFARGLRNTIGFGWHPRSGRMYGMDHGIDWLGDDAQQEELNELIAGAEYGWPYVYDDGQLNPQDEPQHLTQSEWAARSRAPLAGYTAHAAPMQMAFYDGAMFPQDYRGDAFVAMHGSWNRRSPSGYEVVRIHFNEQGAPERFETFLGGFLQGEAKGAPQMLGRPTGVAVAADGALLVGDDTNNVIYRIAHGGAAPKLPEQRLAMEITRSKTTQTLQVTSPAIQPNGNIPVKYSDYGDGVSPPLAWSGAPKNAKSIVVLMEDPQAKSPLPFVHWLAVLPANVSALPEKVDDTERPASVAGLQHGANSKSTLAYFGPRPPEGDAPHPYHFQVFALDRTLDLPSGFNRAAVLKAMRGHVLAQGELVGRFSKPPASEASKKQSPSELEEKKGRKIASDR